MATKRQETADARRLARKESAEEKRAAKQKRALGNAKGLTTEEKRVAYAELLESKERAKAAKAARPQLPGRTAPVTSPAFTMSQHVACIPNWREFMAGNIDLPQACKDGHPLPPTPQERGLIS